MINVTCIMCRSYSKFQSDVMKHPKSVSNGLPESDFQACDIAPVVTKNKQKKSLPLLAHRLEVLDSELGSGLLVWTMHLVSCIPKKKKGVNSFLCICAQ